MIFVYQQFFWTLDIADKLLCQDLETGNIGAKWLWGSQQELLVEMPVCILPSWDTMLSSLYWLSGHA